MSQILVNGSRSQLPYYPAQLSIPSSPTLNATGETCHFVGYCCLQNPLDGSKTISSAGGGSIVWRSAAVTFANAGTTFDIGIQDVSTTATPSQGDGTFDVKASFTGGGGGVTGSAVQTSTMTTGTKTIAHGDLIAITFAMTALGGADSVAVSVVGTDITQNLPAVINNTTGSYVRSSVSLPNAYIVFNDGSIGWIYGSHFTSVVPSLVTVASDTATADEYGCLILSQHTYNAFGITATVGATGNTADFEAILYSDPLGTPVAERTIAVDASTFSGASATRFMGLFSVPFAMKANTPYGVSIRPTTTNSLGLYYSDNNTVAGGGAIAVPNATAYAIRRLDNTGAFSDYNGGTAKTRLMHVYIAGSHMEQGVNTCFNQLGI